MSELDVSTLKPGDQVGHTYSRGGWRKSLGVLVTTTQRRLVALDSPEALSSAVYDEHTRLHAALGQLAKGDAPTMTGAYWAHLREVERVVMDARARATELLRKSLERT